MNRLRTTLRVFRISRPTLLTAVAAVAVALGGAIGPTTSYAASMQTGGGQQGGDQVRDRLQLRDGSCCTTPTLDAILEGDEDRTRARLRDGSCETGCDGEPDQDRVRDRIGR